MGGGAGRGLDFGASYGSGQLPIRYTAKLDGNAGNTPANAHEALSARGILLAEAKTDRVKALVRELYRTDGGIGDGGTADAIRHELATGATVGGRTHIIKGKERLKQIDKMLRRDPLHPDADLLRKLKADLEDALGRSK